MMFRPFLTACLALTLSGCAHISANPGFSDIQEQSNKRLSARIHWRHGGPEDKAIDESLQQLLSRDLTPQAAVQVALLNNRRLQALYEGLGIAQSELVQAGLLGNPVFDAAVKFPIHGGPVDIELAVAQEFLGIFFIPLRKRIAESQFESAKLRVTGGVLDLAQQVREACYRVQADQQIIELRQQVLSATQASYELAKRLYAAGNTRRLDLISVQSMHEQARLDLVSAQADHDQNRERLTALMGLWGDQASWKITARLPDPPDLPDLENVERRAIESSLDLAAAKAEIETLARRLGLTKSAAIFPMLTPGAMAERDSGDWAVGPSVEIPIPLFDLGHARVAGARAELHRRQETYTALAVEIRSAARAARDRLLSTHRIATQYHAVMLPLRNEMMDQTQRQYNAMQLGAFELLAAKQQQIDTARRYIESLRDLWIARSSLDQILAGRLPPQDNPMAGRSDTGPPSQMGESH